MGTLRDVVQDDPALAMSCFATLVVVLGLAAQWLAWSLRIPSIILLLAAGVLLGTWLDVDTLFEQATSGTREATATNVLFPLIELAVAIILFEGGLTLRWVDLKRAGPGSVLRLATAGALISLVATAVFARWILDWGWGPAFLLGAILVVTGPTVISPMLRQVRPERRIGSIVQWEGIVVDPIGAVLAVLVYDYFFGPEAGSGHPMRIALSFAQTFLLGAAIGSVAALLLVQVFRRYLVPDHLHVVAFLAAALGTFFVANIFGHHAGLVTVTVLGIALANQRSVRIDHVLAFKEHLTVFLISSLFIVMGTRLHWRTVVELGWSGPMFLASLILVVRPLSVFGSHIGGPLKLREQAFVAAIAPRGVVAAAVASVFALQLESQGGLAAQLVPVTFLTVIGTVVVYGLATAPIARRLGLSDQNPQGLLIAGAAPWAAELALAVQQEGFRVLLVDTNFGHVSRARLKGLAAEPANITSEHLREEVDLSGIGRLLAMTPNDEVNLLACLEYGHLFGRAHVYRLPPAETAVDRWALGTPVHARTLFADSATFADLARRFAHGEIRRTRLTSEYAIEDHEATYPDALILFVVRDEQLLVRSADDAWEPKENDTLISVVSSPTEAGDPGRSHPSSAE